MERDNWVDRFSQISRLPHPRSGLATPRYQSMARRLEKSRFLVARLGDQTGFLCSGTDALGGTCMQNYNYVLPNQIKLLEYQFPSQDIVQVVTLNNWIKFDIEELSEHELLPDQIKQVGDYYSWDGGGTGKEHRIRRLNSYAWVSPKRNEPFTVSGNLIVAGVSTPFSQTFTFNNWVNRLSADLTSYTVNFLNPTDDQITIQKSFSWVNIAGSKIVLKIGATDINNTVAGSTLSTNPMTAVWRLNPVVANNWVVWIRDNNSSYEYTNLQPQSGNIYMDIQNWGADFVRVIDNRAVKIVRKEPIIRISVYDPTGLIHQAYGVPNQIGVSNYPVVTITSGSQSGGFKVLSQKYPDVWYSVPTNYSSCECGDFNQKVTRPPSPIRAVRDWTGMTFNPCKHIMKVKQMLGIQQNYNDYVPSRGEETKRKKRRKRKKREFRDW